MLQVVKNFNFTVYSPLRFARNMGRRRNTSCLGFYSTSIDYSTHNGDLMAYNCSGDYRDACALIGRGLRHALL